MFLPRRQNYIGLDIGALSMKAVQVQQNGKRVRVEAAAVIPRATGNAPLDTTAIRRVRDVLARQGFKGNKLIVSAPADKLHVELLELPPRHSGAPVDQLARVEMMRLAKLDGNAFEMESWDLPAPPRGGGGTAVMAVAARHADTQSIYETFAEVGLSIEAIDVQACAIARACKPRMNPAGVTPILDLGFSRAVLMFIRDGVVVFQRSFSHCGTSGIQTELTRRLGVDADVAEHLIAEFAYRDSDHASSPSAVLGSMIDRYADALAAEIETSCAYITHRYGDANPETLFVIGGAAGAAGVRDSLKKRLAIEVEPLAPTGLAECSPATMEQCSSALLTAAFGLALYEGE